jgi:hypothetical protein
MPRDIFISYRRDDDPGMALALYAHLERTLSEDSIFMDVEDGIQPGADFVHILEERVDQCQIMLTLIGERWLAVKDRDGRRRLDNPEDYVRIEIESALKLGKRIIPVLINQTEMPRVAELPETIAFLARRQAVRITSQRLRADTHGLAQKLELGLAEIKNAREAEVRQRADAEAKRQQIEAERRLEEQAALDRQNAARAHQNRASSNIPIEVRDHQEDKAPKQAENEQPHASNVEKDSTQQLNESNSTIKTDERNRTETNGSGANTDIGKEITDAQPEQTIARPSVRTIAAQEPRGVLDATKFSLNNSKRRFPLMVVILAILAGLTIAGVTLWPYRPVAVQEQVAVPNTEQSSDCMRQDLFDQTRTGSIPGMGAYLRRCPSGSYADAIRTTLEGQLYDSALDCIQAVCTVDTCLISYLNYFPNGKKLPLLKSARAERLRVCSLMR